MDKSTIIESVFKHNLLEDPASEQISRLELYNYDLEALASDFTREVISQDIFKFVEWCQENIDI